MGNREHEVTDQLDKPAIYQPYKETYLYIASPATLDQHSDCYAYKKPSCLKF
jgi:hypothetical protein